MGLFGRLFGRKTQDNEKKEIENVSSFSDVAEYTSLMDLYRFMKSLLASNSYTAKSEYRNRIAAEKNNVEFFKTLQKSDILEEFCRKNRIDSTKVYDALGTYSHFEEMIDQKNDEYIAKAMYSEKQYLDNILKDVDPKIVLDDDQRKVVLTDEDYTLVIAGAGAGKTTTVAAKVKYLVEKKKIDPKQILVISFTNKAVQELRDKINKDLKIDCPIATFHSTGNAILHKQSPDKLNIVDDSRLYFVLQDYFKNSVLKNESMVNNLILFFSTYFDAPYEGADLNTFFNKIAKSNFTTMRSDLEDYKKEVIDRRSRKAVTIQNEVLRSYQEVEIANFLYINGISYEYEPIYRYDIQFSRKPYTPDFIIRQGDNIAYIEHFGITEDGRNNRYSEDELQSYKKAVNDKILLHRQHNTKLIYTFSGYKDRRPLIDHLKEQLENKGFVLQPRSNKEIMEKLVSSEENRYIRKLLALICRFISNFKTNGYTADEFNRMYHETQNVRSRLFLDICHDCYLEYDRYLKENNAIDFQDMINDSARILKNVKEMKQKLDFKYIIVDEYQDISRQRFDLTSALSEVTDAKIIAVGDDWQSIYAFSGSDITLFTKFAETMGYAKLLKIVKTYRNSQEVIDIAGNFIQKNKAQISKELISPKHLQDPVIIYTYDGSRKKSGDTNKSGANYNLAKAVEKALEQIIAFNKKEGKNNKTSTILLLGRFGFDGDLLEKSGLFEYIRHGNGLRSVKYPFLNMTFMTAHASKGLGYDNVIVINGKNETYGFPSKIEDDPVLAFVIKGDRSIDYAEERRLFYVAMTRTKNRVFFVAPEQNPSEFLLEIKHDYKNVRLQGNWNDEEIVQRMVKKPCPMCGYPMQYKYKYSFGLRLWICTNEPELCGFMTNEYKAGKLGICKCDRCRDGYLIVKPAKNKDYFLGCTNYKHDKTGCDRVMPRKYYYDIMHIQPDEPVPASLPIPEPPKEPVSVEKTESKEPCEKEIPVEIKEADIKGVFYKGQNLNTAVLTILRALEHISVSKYFGKQILISVLRGGESDKILKNQLNTIPEYNSMRGLTRRDLDIIVDWLIENKYILKTNHPQYPVLHPTYNGRHYGEVITTGQLKKLLKELENPVNQ